jgi:hypothetical protein
LRQVSARRVRSVDRFLPRSIVVLTLLVDRQRLSSTAHSYHPIAAPIYGVNVNRLLRRADRGPAARILDLGCGEAA